MVDKSYDRRTLIFPGLAGLYETFSPYSYSLMRFAAGALLVPHGIQKIMNGGWTTRGLRHEAEAQEWRLLLVLLLWVGAPSADANRTRSRLLHKVSSSPTCWCTSSAFGRFCCKRQRLLSPPR